jgi:phage shock protein A
MTRFEIKKMQVENKTLRTENDQLIKEQREFQEALKKQVDRIKKLGPWKRFWAAVQLVKDLITTIEAGLRT